MGVEATFKNPNALVVKATFSEAGEPPQAESRSVLMDTLVKEVQRDLPESPTASLGPNQSIMIDTLVAEVQRHSPYPAPDRATIVSLLRHAANVRQIDGIAPAIHSIQYSIGLVYQDAKNLVESSTFTSLMRAQSAIGVGYTLASNDDTPDAEDI